MVLRSYIEYRIGRTHARKHGFVIQLLIARELQSLSFWLKVINERGREIVLHVCLNSCSHVQTKTCLLPSKNQTEQSCQSSVQFQLMDYACCLKLSSAIANAGQTGVKTFRELRLHATVFTRGMIN